MSCYSSALVPLTKHKFSIFTSKYRAESYRSKKLEPSRFALNHSPTKQTLSNIKHTKLFELVELSGDANAKNANSYVSAHISSDACSRAARPGGGESRPETLRGGPRVGFSFPHVAVRMRCAACPPGLNRVDVIIALATTFTYVPGDRECVAFAGKSGFGGVRGATICPRT